MEELIKKIYEDKMTDGTFEKIVAEHFDKMIGSVCDKLMGWNSEFSSVAQEKMKPLLLHCLERSDFNSYTIKLETLINETLKTSQLSNYKNILDTLKGVVSPDSLRSAGAKFKFGQHVTVSEIFKKYQEFLEYEFDDKDIFEEKGLLSCDDYGAENAAEFECYMKVETVEVGSYFKSEKKVLKLHHELNTDEGFEEDEEYPKTKFEIELVEKYDKAGYRLQLDHYDLKLSQLRNMPSFCLYLLDLQNAFAAIQIDKYDDSANVEITFGE